MHINRGIRQFNQAQHRSATLVFTS